MQTANAKLRKSHLSTAPEWRIPVKSNHERKSGKATLSPLSSFPSVQNVFASIFLPEFLLYAFRFAGSLRPITHLTLAPGRVMFWP